MAGTTDLQVFAYWHLHAAAQAVAIGFPRALKTIQQYDISLDEAADICAEYGIDQATFRILLELGEKAA
jgi:hypothetical protein